MNELLQKYGLIVISAAVGLALVALGIFGHEQMATMAGIGLLGASAGTHVGAHTEVIPLTAADVASLEPADQKALLTAAKKLL